MKNQAMIILVITVAGLAAGCKRPVQGVDDPPAPNTNTASVSPLPPATGADAAGARAWAGIQTSLAEASAYTYEQKKALFAKADAGLTNLDQRIKDLTDQADHAGQAGQAALQTKVQQLRDERAVLDQKLAAVKIATAGDWDGVKTNFLNAWQETEKSFTDAWQALHPG
jgi:hypothetical protein